MAFVGDDRVKGVYGNILLGGVFIWRLIPGVEDGGVAEQINRHPLDGADVNERISGLRVEQVTCRQDGRVEFLAFVKILALESLAVDFVYLVELEARLGLERRKRSDSLSGKGAA